MHLILLYSFGVCLSEKCFICPCILIHNITGRVSYVEVFFFFPFWTLGVSCFSFQPGTFLQRNQLIALWEFICTLVFVFLLLPVELSLAFTILIIICFVAGLFGFIWFEIAALLLPGYLFSSLGLGHFQLQFLQICFQSPFLLILLLGSLLCIYWQLYIIPYVFFFSF